jgi:hypothetical protein
MMFPGSGVLLMNAVEALEEVLTADQAQQLIGSDPRPVVEAPSSTQQLLDELLGRFEDDDSSMVLAHGLTPEFCTDSDE